MTRTPTNGPRAHARPESGYEPMSEAERPAETISDADRAEVLAMLDAFDDAVPGLKYSGDESIRRWLAIRDHVLAQHECPSLPVWRPVAAGEIREGWEVRFPYGSDGSLYAVAHHRDEWGNWWTEGDEWNLSDMAGLETTAPLPEPEPWPDELLEEVAGRIELDDRLTFTKAARSILDHLAAEGLIERPKAGA